MVYNSWKLDSAASLEHSDVRLMGTWLKMTVGSSDAMLQPEEQQELLARTVSICALVDENEGILVVMGKTPSSVDNISLGLLESHHHVRSYFEANGQAGRTIKWSELTTFADEKGLRIILHKEGSLHWQSRPLGGDSGTLTASVRNAGASWISPSSRLLSVSEVHLHGEPLPGKKPMTISQIGSRASMVGSMNFPAVALILFLAHST